MRKLTQYLTDGINDNLIFIKHSKAEFLSVTFQTSYTQDDCKRKHGVQFNTELPSVFDISAKYAKVPQNPSDL